MAKYPKLLAASVAAHMHGPVVGLVHVVAFVRVIVAMSTCTTTPVSEPKYAYCPSLTAEYSEAPSSVGSVSWLTSVNVLGSICTTCIRVAPNVPKYKYFELAATHDMVAPDTLTKS